MERDHEALVGDLFQLLGYRLPEEIRFRLGRMDICLLDEQEVLLIGEVKKDWDLSSDPDKALRQAYNYANEQVKGIRYVVITNADYYAVYDRKKGLSYQDSLVGRFRITRLDMEGLAVLETLRKGRLLK